MDISKKLKVSYGLGAVGKDMVYSLVAGFLMYYYTDVLSISSAFVGTMFMAARLFDAFNDPIMGVLVSKTKGKYGKFRPWIMTGTVLNALVLVAVFNMPIFENHTTTLITASILYFLWGITYTMMDIPFWSFIPAITSNAKDRESISVIARSCAAVGFAIPVAITLLLVDILGGGNEKLGFGILAVIIAVIFILSAMLVFKNVKEKENSKSEVYSLKEIFSFLLKNDQALIIVIAIVIFNSSLYLTQNMAIYFFKYDIGNSALFGVFGTVGGIAQILSMMSLPLLRKKFSRKAIFAGALSITIAGYIGMYLLGLFKLDNILALCVMAIIIFIGFGLATVLTTIFLADCVDYGEYKFGARFESVIFSLQTFVVKFASAIAVFIAGWGIEFIKLDETQVVQSEATLLGLRFIMIVIPIIGLIACILFFLKKYKLDDKFYNKIINEIKVRKENGNNSTK